MVASWSGRLRLTKKASNALGARGGGGPAAMALVVMALAVVVLVEPASPSLFLLWPEKKDTKLLGCKRLGHERRELW